MQDGHNAQIRRAGGENVSESETDEREKPRRRARRGKPREGRDGTRRTGVTRHTGTTCGSDDNRGWRRRSRREQVRKRGRCWECGSGLVLLREKPPLAGAGATATRPASRLTARHNRVIIYRVVCCSCLGGVVRSSTCTALQCTVESVPCRAGHARDRPPRPSLEVVV